MTDLTEAPPAPRQIRFDPRRARPGRDYGHAHRHSRRVRWLKFALPAAALAGIAGFFLAMRFEIAGEGISLAGLDFDDKSLVMKEPHISGFEGTRRAYDVKAVRAVQDLDNPKIVTLEKIVAKFGLDADSIATVDATTGVFNAATNMLNLKDGIAVTTTDGYQAKFDDAEIDIDKGSLSSKRPVEIRGADGMIKANAIEVGDRGKKVRFHGGVSLSFVPGDDGSLLPELPASAP